MLIAPDSALTLVRRIEEHSLLTKRLRARHALLMTMAQDKCYIDIAEDSTIRVAYDYYQHHGNRRSFLLSTYYLGVIRQNAKDYINAAVAFREAEPIANALEDYRQLSLIDQHLSRIFAANYDHIRALEYAERALDAAEKAGESMMADFCRLDMAEQLLAEYRYEEAESMLIRLQQSNDDNPIMCSYISQLLSRVYLFNGSCDYERAKDCYQEILRLNVLKLNSEDYGRLALIKELEGDSMTADHYLRVAEREIHIKTDSLVFYNDCYNVYERRGDWKKALENLVSRSKLQDEMEMALLGQSVTHAMEYYYQERLEIERLRSRSRVILFSLIGFVLLVFIFGLSLLLKKKNQQLLEDMATIQEVSDDVIRLRKEESSSSQIVNQLIADKVKSLQQLSESYFSWEDDAVRKREEKKGKLFKDEIIASFRMQLGELRKDHSFIVSLEQSLNLTNDGIMEKAHMWLTNIKERDFSVLALLFSGFSIKSISYLLRMSEVSLRMRKTRFKQQFESMSEPLRSLFLTKLG